MQIIDAQVHVYERNTAARPWTDVLAGPDEVTGGMMVAALNAVGVDGAIVVSPYAMYRFDPSYALAVASQWPDRFAVVAPVDPSRPDIADFVAQWAQDRRTVGLRLMIYSDADVERLVGGGADAFLRAAARYRQPICLACFGRAGQIAAVPRRHPDVQFVIDHLGLHQPFVPPVPVAPFVDLPPVLALADCPNVFIKVTGVPTLSKQPFPYDDIWPQLTRVFDAFGIDRCMWGTDWTRATAFLSQQQAVLCFSKALRLSPSDRERLMGGTLRQIFRWSPGLVG